MAPTSSGPYRGVFPVAPTIFDDRGELDLDGQRRCIDFMIDAGSNGIVYDSARHDGGECVAVFYPDLVAPCVQAEHLIYRWNGVRIEAVLKVTPVERQGLPRRR